MNAPSLTSLLIRWEEAHTEGISLSAAELCIDSPHLIPELQKAIDALQAMQHLIGTKATSAPVAAESWATIFPPEGRTNLASDQIFSPSSANQTPAPAGYEVLEELGRGGMGVVYKARQRTLNRLCALKVILDAGHADTDQRVRFLIEAEAIARIKHPGIVQIYDFGTYGGLPYFSMELCENGSLADRLRHGPLTAREASAIVENVARAVHAAHESGIVHRDLKPGNVLLAADGSPRVTDFGLAKRTYTEGHTQTGAVMGTPSYMAPEQAGGKKEIGPAVDVWALGAILYEGLSGRPPFGAATPLDTLMQVIDDEPVTLRQLNKKVPVDLETICHKCLHKIPAKRYQSAGALAEDLNRWLTNEPISARPVGTTERVLRWVKKRPAIAGLAALLAVLTIGSMMVILSFYRDASEQARIAGQERETALEAETRARTAQGEAEGQRDHAELRTQMSQYAFRLAQIQRELAGKGLSESGISRASSLFEQCSQPLRGWEYEHLRLQLGHRVFLQKKNPPHEDRVQSICYSRDGRSIVTSTTRQIRVWDAVTGRVEKTLDAGKSRIKSVHLSPDGRWLACGGHAYDEEGNEFNEEKEHDAPLIMTRGVFDKGMRARAVVMVWDLNNKERQPRKLEVKGKSIVAVRFAPDGSWLASAGSEKTVWIWDVDSWKRQPKEIIAPESVDCLEIHPGGNLLALGSNKQVLLYDRATGKVLHTLTGHQGVINRVSFSGDGRLLASADLADGLVHVWDTTTGKRLRSLGDKAAGTAVSIAFAPGKRAVLACGFTDPSGYTLVDADSGTTLGRVRSSHLAAEGVVFSPDAKRLAFTTLEGVGSVPMNSLGSKPVWLEDESLALLNQRFSEADKKCAPEMLLSASSVEVRANAPANSFSVIEKETGLPLAEFRTFPIDAGKPLPIQTPGGLVRVETRPDAILIRNSRTKSVQLLFPSLSEDKYRVAFTSDRTRMVSLANRTVKLWDTATGVEIATWETSVQTVNQIGFDDDTNSLIVVGQAEVEIRSVGCPHTPTSATRWHLHQYLRAYTDERWEDAIHWLDYATRAYPTNHRLCLDRALALLASERPAEAVEELKRGMEISPPSERPLSWWLADLGSRDRSENSRYGASPSLDRLAAQVLFRPTRANVNIGKIVAANPNSWSLRALHGYLLTRAGKLDEGITELVAAARQVGNRPDLWAAVASLELQRKGVTAADAARRELVRLVPDAVMGWHEEQVRTTLGHASQIIWHDDYLQGGKSNRELVKDRNTPDLYTLFVGVDDYSKAKFPQKVQPTLTSVAGVNALSDVFNAQKGKRYRDVHNSLLLQEKVTSNSIIERLSDISKKARPEDWAIIFLNGHGIVHDEQFDYICSDTNHSVRSSFLEGRQLLATIQGMRCRTLLLVDVCHSGALIPPFTRIIPSERLFIFAACKSDQNSLEPSKVIGGHSIFTQGLLEAMRPSTGDLNGDGYLDLRELQASVQVAMAKQLNRLAQGADAQTPVTHPLRFPRMPILEYPRREPSKDRPPSK